MGQYNRLFHRKSVPLKFNRSISGISLFFTEFSGTKVSTFLSGLSGFMYSSIFLWVFNMTVYFMPGINHCCFNRVMYSVLMLHCFTCRSVTINVEFLLLFSFLCFGYQLYESGYYWVSYFWFILIFGRWPEELSVFPVIFFRWPCYILFLGFHPSIFWVFNR